jgi:hypothetical protein
VLQWARVNGCEWNEDTFSAVVGGGGHLAVLQWAWDTSCEWDAASCWAEAPAGSETREWIEAQPA